MLKKIIFENLYSFSEPQVIEFNSTENIYAIYGKNSAGKTNLLQIINFLYKTIHQKIENFNELHEMSCKYNESNEINIGAQIEIEQIQYFYSISIDVEAKKYMYQELLKLNNNGETTSIFKLENGQLTSDVLNKSERGVLQSFNIIDNGIFPYLKNVKKSDNFDFLLKIVELADFQLSTNEGLEYLAKNPGTVEKIVEELKNIDIDIDGIELIDRKKMKQQILKDIEKNNEDTQREFLKIVQAMPNFEIQTLHQGQKFRLGMESSGTNRYLDLLIEHYTEDVLNIDIPRMIDELEIHLHTDVFLKYIDFYQKNSHRQLFFTTHNQEILDKKILSKHNIIIIDKKESISEAYLLADYQQIRSDERHNWKKMYNKFMFGGKPNVF